LSHQKPSTIYLTRNGLLEPLGQSQVLSYLRGLSQHYSITLITYEKPDDWANNSRVIWMRQICQQHDIRWLPQKFRKGPLFIAPALSMMWMTFMVWREVRSNRAHLIHTRSYIPAIVAIAVGSITRVPFIFDMRALWPEELITAGRLRRGSLLHKAIVIAERACLRQAEVVVSLTHAAVAHLKLEYPNELSGQHIAIIPTCADLDRFSMSSDRAVGPCVHGCIGTILSGWFRTEWMATWLSVTSQKDPSARFEFITRDDITRVRSVIDPTNKLGNRLVVKSLPPEEMHEAVQGHDFSIMFYAGGELSELGRSPTRMAEVLGCGLPIVANEGIGDVADIISQYNIGVIVRDGSEAAIAEAFDALEALRSDPNLSWRCRKAAEEVFSLEAGTEAYCKIYAQILERSGDVESSYS
jgi:glycosyltransferase involved in cell wall biosynthesis